VVILDLNMPGMGGAAALRRIRELRPALPVLLATGRADQQALDLVASVPGVTLLAKPFSMADLRTLLDRPDAG
jgi:CheY-like chemotaxis protein